MNNQCSLVLVLLLSLVLAGCGENAGNVSNKVTASSEPTKPAKPAKPAKPTREMINDFCSDMASMQLNSRTKTAVVDAARYAGIEGSEKQLSSLYLAVLRGNLDVQGAITDNAFSQLTSGYSSTAVPDFEKACQRHVRKTVSEGW